MRESHEKFEEAGAGGEGSFGEQLAIDEEAEGLFEIERIEVLEGGLELSGA